MADKVGTNKAVGEVAGPDRGASEKAVPARIDVPEGLWTKCPSCGATVYRKNLEENLHVCPECNYHHRIDARTRVAQLADENSFEEFCEDLVSTDPLKFKDRISYKQRLKEKRDRTGQNEAMIVGHAFIRGRAVVLGVMDSSFIMASMGAVVGEKVTAAAEEAIKHDKPLVIVTASGGARMQEGLVSLVQMAKTSSALGRLNEAGGLYITVLTDPTTAGVAASFASLGDVAIAEPKAMIGFAGPRVIWNTIKAELPEGFQTAEFLLQHGFVDRIVNRKDLRTEIARLIDYCGK